LEKSLRRGPADRRQGHQGWTKEAYQVVGVMAGIVQIPFDGSPLSGKRRSLGSGSFFERSLEDRTNEFGIGSLDG